MNAEQVLKSDGIYFKNDLIGDVPSSVGYIKKFRWSWFATQLNTFVFIGETANIIDRTAIETFSGACYKYALKNNKGWPRGFQSGIGSIAILSGENIETSAINFCESIAKKHWAAFEIPVVHNIAGSETYRFKKNPIWGTLYFPYFATVIDNLIKRF